MVAIWIPLPMVLPGMVMVVKDAVTSGSLPVVLILKKELKLLCHVNRSICQ